MSKEVKLNINKQPHPFCRFRYKSEKTLDVILGDPEIELQGYYGSTAYIRCTAYQVDREFPHPVKLLLKNPETKELLSDPLIFEVTKDNFYKVLLQGIYIQIPTKRDQLETLVNKQIRLKQIQLKGQQHDTLLLLKTECNTQTINLITNKVRLCFEAFKIVDDKLVQLCAPEYSTFIKNSCLRIDDLSVATSFAKGDQKLMLLIQRYNKNGIEVWFYKTENDELGGTRIWEMKGNITNIHYQNTIVLKTPPFMDLDIIKTEKVFIELLDKTDNSLSIPVSFDYKPNEDAHEGNEPDDEFYIEELRKTFITESNIKDTMHQGDLKPDGDEFLCPLPTQLRLKDYFKADRIGSTANMSDRNKEKIRYECSKIIEELEMGKSNFNTILNKMIIDGKIELFKIIIIPIVVKKRGTIFQKQNVHGQSALHLACLHDRPEFIQLLIESGCDPNLQDLSVRTALHIAVQNNKEACIKALLNPNYIKINNFAIDVNLRNNDGFSPLHLAIENNNLNVVKILIEYDKEAVITEIITNGNNTLHYAIELDRIKIVDYILKNTNIDLYACNFIGQTPLELAQSLDPKSEISNMLATRTI